MANAGRFEIELSEPYPITCKLKIDGLMVGIFHHKDLRDLEYTANKAKRDAKLKLPHGDKEEV